MRKRTTSEEFFDRVADMGTPIEHEAVPSHLRLFLDRLRGLNLTQGQANSLIAVIKSRVRI